MSSVSLYPHQRLAVERLHNGCILCGGVGSGKSRTSLAYYYKCCGGDLDDTGDKFCCIKDPIDLYIITTARKRDTLDWEGEMVVWQFPSKVVVDSWNNINKYKDVTNAFFIFDEQRVVGKGAWVKSFLKIARSNQWILLSATPGDKWEDYIPVFIANGFYKNRSEFSREHLIYASFTKFPKVTGYLNTGRLVRLRRRILVFMDFKRMTTPHHIDVWVDYDVVKYKDICRNRWDYKNDRPIESPSEFCYALRQVINSDISRQKAVTNIVRERLRCIIFYKFDYELDILRELDYGKGVAIAEWNGHAHQPIPETNKWVYLVQYTAGCEGWNCISTDTIIFYSQDYSYKTMIQAAGRTDRLNTPYVDLYFYHLKSRAGIDLAISKALKAKKDFNITAFAKGE